MKIPIGTKFIKMLFATGMALQMTGCTAFRASTENVSVEEEQHFDSRFDATDMRSITRQAVDNLLASEFLIKQTDRPIMMIAGVQNRTNDHIDTKNITDRIRTMIFRTSKVRFVNEARRADLLEEQGYQAENVTPEMQVGIGKQLGAQYMLSGSLTEIKRTSPKQVRVSKQVLRNYKFTIEVTDLESSEISWIDEIEFARRDSQPLIGW